MGKIEYGGVGSESFLPPSSFTFKRNLALRQIPRHSKKNTESRNFIYMHACSSLSQNLDRIDILKLIFREFYFVLPFLIYIRDWAKKNIQEDWKIWKPKEVTKNWYQTTSLVKKKQIQLLE